MDFEKPKLGDESVHHSYDDVALELRRAVSRLVLPLAAAVRHRHQRAEMVLRLERDELSRARGSSSGAKRAAIDTQQWVRNRPVAQHEARRNDRERCGVSD
jgi:hypothetical protein